MSRDVVACPRVYLSVNGKIESKGTIKLNLFEPYLAVGIDSEPCDCSLVGRFNSTRWYEVWFSSTTLTSTSLEAIINPNLHSQD